MPELPEVETVCRALRPGLVGKTIRAVKTMVPRLRRPLDLRELRKYCVGAKIKNVRRRAKYIVIDLTGDRALLLHLGMTGSCRFTKPTAPLLPHDRVTWTLTKTIELRFNDIRRFGEVRVVALPPEQEWPSELSSLGPEPLEKEFTAASLFARTRKRKVPLKVLIMEQAVVVGVGNIYASEALFRAGIRPGKIAAKVSRDECARLVKTIRTVLRAAIKAGGTTISDFKTPDGSEGWFTRKLRVYGRAGEPCRTCKTLIKRTVLGGRATFHCPQCQA